ncbi:hypothetical protein EPUS_05692 [Endocarpon pusillum Z07020]|uniref:Uncharacterized protein n=1 Tax=Endocarpon pusillum (strain Z07020 / HMAS-L-300199) TaxID=1263415 RepID=U1GKE2_ENDPU|nr:uncharacterized protein EPUS_05692 [Endocarpon pusillum Z07020]ERF72638.1 hypothetical protein EPUS_05692 [Endocarpon pusillum Z07020]
MSSTSSSSISTWWTNLSIYARAGLVIGCLLAFLFLFSTIVLCIVRRGRLLTSRRRGASVPKPAYRSPQPAAESKFTHSTTVEVQDGDEGAYAGQSRSGFGAGAMPPLLGEEVALREYDGRGRGYGYEYGYGHAHGYGVGDKGDADGYAREEGVQREQRTWNAV